MKVFVVGFHKTGTSSLEAALRQLGYRVTGPNRVRNRHIARTYRQVTARLSQRYDAFQDNPWPLVYREMDAMWPGAKFILTTRDHDAWIRSALRQFAHRSTPMRELIYGPGKGSPQGNEAHYVAVLQAHEAAVRAYFADRERDFLEMDITRGDGWDKLCRFLDRPVPDQPFPRVNSADQRLARRLAAKWLSANFPGLYRRLRRS